MFLVSYLNDTPVDHETITGMVYDRGMAGKTKYVTLNIEPSARQALAQFAYALTGKASARVSQTMAVRIASEVAIRHLDEAVTAIGDSEADR